VVSVPELRNDKEFLSFNNALIKSAFNTLAGLFLVTVVRCRVNKSVATLDSCVDSFSAAVFGDFPAAETTERHLIA